MNIKNTFSITSNDLTEFKRLIEDKISQFGKPSLGILFINADLDIEGVHQFMDENSIAHIGTSSSGEICNETCFKGVYTGLFIYMPEEHFKIYHSPDTTTDLSGEELGTFAKNAFDNPGIYMLIASKDTQTDLFIKDVQKTTSDKVPLYGGHAIDNLKFEKYTVFSNNHLTNKGVVAIVFNCDKVEMHGDAYSGWDSIGSTHTITKSEGNELLEIDGKAALDVFGDYFDYIDLKRVASGEDDSYIIGNHPIQITESNGSTYLKSPMHLDLERKSMTYYCSVPVGTKFKFCNNPKIEITDNLINRVKEIKASNVDIDCFLVTSCASRHLSLGPFFNKEVKQIFEIWDKPMAGFLSGGEIGNVKESNMSCFHNVTSVFTGFKLK